MSRFKRANVVVIALDRSTLQRVEGVDQPSRAREGSGRERKGNARCVRSSSL